MSWNALNCISELSKTGHAPHGACELKFLLYRRYKTADMSRSPRSVWVEILEWIKTSQNSKSRSPRSVWVEILRQFCICIIINVTLPTERVSWNNFFINRQQNCTASRSPRSVWVEICYIFVKKKLQIVTFPTERVSWNNLHLLQFAPFHSHAPHGACELKSILFFGRNNSAESRSPRSVWVEI